MTEEPIRLTQLVPAGGCARKLGAEDLMKVLREIAPFPHPWVDPSVGSMEDAAILRPPDGPGLVFTVDFITPIVDDPEAFGAIAATNALSDVYAMGGEPQAALAVCGFPSETLPSEILERVFKGGRDKAAEAGCAIVGGHTIKDPELKYGLCVIGTLDGRRALVQTQAQVGDALVLTKPLGFGIASQAIKNGALGAAELAEVTRLMTTLNKTAKDAALAAGAHAATDVTGFGLLTHLHNLVSASGVAARIERAAVPVLEFVPALARAGLVPGGSHKNFVSTAPFCTWASEIDEIDRLLLADAQTSGGLLIAVPHDRADLLVRELT
ncbi:MAG TPA: selenide, water dikinase SelD, partial [Dongiaceae bacterium]|nr:selenide, water dikinase SelD [Dongiaceae bacterium]